jgi:hypothetical protein
MAKTITLEAQKDYNSSLVQYLTEHINRPGSGWEIEREDHEPGSESITFFRTNARDEFCDKAFSHARDPNQIFIPSRALTPFLRKLLKEYDQKVIFWIE